MTDPLKTTGPKPYLLKRRDAAQKTLDRFEGSAFNWSSNDCMRLAACHARNLGHKVPVPKAGAYRDPKGALRHLRQLTGAPRIERALDQYFEPIPPAFAVTGDIIAMPSADGEEWPAIFIMLDNGRALGFIEVPDGPTVCMVATPIPERISLAWRVEPL